MSKSIHRELILHTKICLYRKLIDGQTGTYYYIKSQSFKIITPETVILVFLNFKRNLELVDGQVMVYICTYSSEIPGSLVSEPKHRDPRSNQMNRNVVQEEFFFQLQTIFYS